MEAATALRNLHFTARHRQRFKDPLEANRRLFVWLFYAGLIEGLKGC
jgi:hypothetical protein